jgi:hypothetical protein
MLDSKLCKSITVVEVAGSGAATQVVSAAQLQLPKNKNKRKVSKDCKGPEKNQRIMLEALGAYAGRALELHEKSAHKKKDAWLRDSLWNHHRALIRANKKLRKLE